MNDSHDIDMPYHPGCKHRYMEHLDHNALIKRLNEIADEIYNLTQLCRDLETRLSDHNTDVEAHRYLRELINTTNNRLATVKETIDNSLSILENKVDSNYSTLTAADGQLATRLDNVDTEIWSIRTDIENITLDLDDSITSAVNGNTPIIKSVTTEDNVILAELPSEHGKFRYGTNETKNVVTYTADNNSTGIPNYTATLLDESGNTSFPGIVTAPTLRGNADTATLAAKTDKLNTPITLAIKDASGEHLGSSVTTDLSSNITLKVPSVLKDTNITGIANRAHNDATGADIVDTYVHKTSINEEIDGTKTFNDVLKGSNIEPKVHTGSRLGNTTVPYENVYATNIAATNADIPNITGDLTGNADTATKLATARKINGTDFDGTTAITTFSWGTARNISISDASNTNTGAAVSVNGSSNITLKLPSIIRGTLTGNASTATKLAVSKKINNTSFDGSSDITTAIWGTARDVSIADNTGEHVGTKVSVNGSSNITLKLPSNITATLTGNADTATQFSSNTTVKLTGDATGTSAGSKKGWSIPVTLANTGVIAGIYGHNTTNTNIQANTGSFMVPIISVDSKGRITYIQDNPCTIKTPVYTAGSGITLSSSNQFGLTTLYDRNIVFDTVIAGRLEGKRLHFTRKHIVVDPHGRISGNSYTTEIIIDLSSLGGMSVGESITFYVRSRYNNGELVSGSQLYASYSKRSNGFDMYGQQNGTWIATGNAWHVDNVQWTEQYGGGSHTSSVSYSSNMYAQNFRKLSV